MEIIHARIALVAVASAAAVFAFGDVALEVGKHAEPRFVLTLSKAPSNKPVEVVSSNAVSSSVRDTSGVFRYEWKFAAGAPVESASATVRCSDDETRYRFQVKVADGWHLEKRAFPEIQCPLTGADGAQKWFMTGRANGGYGHGCAMYSSNGNGAGAFAATWDDSEGMYFGVEDGSDETRNVYFRDTPSGRVLSECVQGWRTGEVSMDYDIVVRRVRRGALPLVWSDFCDIYRKWGDRQPWSGKPLAERDDVPVWLKSGAAEAPRLRSAAARDCKALTVFGDAASSRVMPDPLDRPRITRSKSDGLARIPSDRLRDAPRFPTDGLARIRKTDADSTISQSRYGRNQPPLNHDSTILRVESKNDFDTTIPHL